MNLQSKRAFTIVELATVLVIIGLVAGGLIVGNNLRRTSQLQSAILDVQNFTNVTDQFRTKYHALPGDMPNATSFWATTVNGNGDEQVALGPEMFRYWQQLSLANMINGPFSGVAGSGGAVNAVPGINVPAFRGGGGYVLYWVGTVFGLTTLYDDSYLHVFSLGAVGNSNSYTDRPVLTASEAQRIDKKIDDGLPGSGKVMAPKQGAANAPNCATSATAYNTGLAGPSCPLLFKLGR